MIKLMDGEYYQLPDGRYVMAADAEGGWLLWMITEKIDSPESLAFYPSPPPPEFDPDKGLPVTPSGVILDGLKEICKIDDLKDTGYYNCEGIVEKRKGEKMDTESKSPRTKQVNKLAEEIAEILYDESEFGEDEIESIFNWLESDHTNSFIKKTPKELADEYWEYLGGN